MAEELHLSLLGNLEIHRDGVPVKGFISNKVPALLCYLAVTGRPHLRPALAGLLWGDMPEVRARNNLSKALTNLRQLVGPSYLSTDRLAVALNPESSYWLDVELFEALLGGASTDTDIDRLQRAVELYRGDFLEGFYVRQAPAFEEWALAQRGRLRELALQALHTLAAHHTGQGEAGRAAGIDYTTRLLALEPWREEAHRQLMGLLARSGQRGAALAQYELCRQVLAAELGVEPGAETVALYNRIRDGEVAPLRQRETALPGPATVAAPPEPAPPSVPAALPTAALPAAPQLPAFLRRPAEPPEAGVPAFVARERELAQLETRLDAAIAGEGGIVFVTGDAGRGKTALMREHTRQAMDQHPDLLVATGNCNAYSGLGDPYLPFCELLTALTGDVQARWAAGDLTREHARRLWEALPLAVGALLEHGTTLIDLLIPGAPLVARARAAAAADWVQQLQTAVDADKPAPGDGAQSQLFEQTTDLLRGLAAKRPLLLLLDDLQWADDASVSLLVHLGSRLSGSRILIVGAYRPEEVALGRGGERHPLDKVLAEFKRRYGDVWIDLAQADETEGQRFVEAYLETEPNRLGEAFRRALFEHAGGHPLFTVELLRALQERGELARDEEGRWVEGPGLDWDRLPARVEGVVEERIGRLEEELREILSVASVEGEVFTAQVVAAIEQVGERQILRLLSRELEKRHRLVREGEALSVGSLRLARYQFAHALSQQYLYNDLSEGERALLHGEIAEVLEALYAEDTDPIVAQLAHHYARAGIADRAAEYLTRAGDRARLAYAHQTAIDCYRQAVAFLKQQGRYGEAARTLMKLGLTCHNAFRFAETRQAYEEGFRLWQQASRTVLSAPLSTAPHALRVHGYYWEEPSTLDPAFAADYSSATAVGQLFASLATLTPERNVVPDVAQRWELLEGGRRYVFHLRDDVCWSDSVPLTAGDFEYAWKRILDPATESPQAGQFCSIRGARAYRRGKESDAQRVGVRAVGDYTLVVELEDPSSDFLYDVTDVWTVAVPQHAVQARGRAWADPERLVTSGPFRLAAWERNQSLILERSPTYHGSPVGNVERVQLLFGPEHDARALELYEQDQLDVLDLRRMPLIVQDRARQQHAAEYVSQPIRGVIVAGLNVNRPPLNDRRVRRALVLGVDRERLADVVYGGLQFPATGGLWPPGTVGHSPGIALPYDPERARRLLAEAGYPGGRGFPTIEALGIAKSTHLHAVEYLRAQWLENMGIDVPCQVVEVSEWVKRMRPGSSVPKPFIWYVDVSLAGRDDQVHSIFESWWLTAGWQNEAYRRLEEASRRVADPQERLRICREAEQILVEEAPTIVLMYQRMGLLVKPWVTRLPLGASRGAWWNRVVIEPH